jgi:oligosaccharyltransferase complex subunit beta
MKSFLSLLLLGLVGLVQALSSTGNRLLVVLEEASDKSKYSSFFGDLECESCLSFARNRTDRIK